jgi:hypothetical protein
VTLRRRVYWANQHGCCAPLDAWLGLSQKYSQGVREMVCRLGLDSSYRKASEDLGRLAQITLSYQTFREVLQREGQKIRHTQRSEAYGPTFKASNCRRRAEDPTCLITGADGFQVPLITDAEQRQRRANAKRRREQLRQQGHTLKPLPPRPHGADQKWKEAKLVTFYDPGNERRYTAATTGNHQVLGRLIRRHATQLELDQADRKYSVSDGADWIRNQYHQQLPMLDATILDYYHLREHTVNCAKVLYGEGTDEATEWRKALVGTLQRSGPIEVVTELGVLAKSCRGRKRRALKGLQGYIGKRIEMLDYPRFLAEDYQIGSGPTEAQCKSLSGRLKGRGRRWNRPGVNAHMAISCLYNNSKQWSTYWPQAKLP